MVEAVGIAAWEFARRSISRCIIPVTIAIIVAAAAPSRAGGLEDLEKCRQAIAAQADDVARSMCARALKDPSLPAKRRAEAHFNRGWVAREAGEALAEYNAAIALDPELGWAYLSRGYVLRNMGRYDQALADLTTATKLMPREALAWLRRGEVLLAMGRRTDALRDFEHLTAIEPRWNPAWHRRATAETLLGDNDRALASLDRALKLLPTDAGSLELRAMVHAEQGDWKAASADADASVRFEPSNADSLLTRGRIALLSGDNDRAIADMNSALPRLDDPTRRVFGAIWMSMAVWRSGRQMEFVPPIMNFIARDKDSWPAPIAWAYLTTLGKANPRWDFGSVADHLARAHRDAQEPNRGPTENRACEYNHLLGTYHVLAGDPERGRDMLRQAVGVRLYSWCYKGAKAELARLDQPGVLGKVR